MPKLIPWKTLRTDILLDRSPWLRVMADAVELPDGAVIEGYLRLETQDVAMVVPIDESGDFVMIRSYKQGVGDIDLQPPAGLLEPGEDPLEGAKRELREETGCEAAAWQAMGAYVMAGNQGAGRVHLFLATGCHQVAKPASGDLEEQQVERVPLVEVRRRLVRSEFGQLATVAALSLALAHLGGAWGRR